MAVTGPILLQAFQAVKLIADFSHSSCGLSCSRAGNSEDAERALARICRLLAARDIACTLSQNPGYTTSGGRTRTRLSFSDSATGRLVEALLDDRVIPPDFACRIVVESASRPSADATVQILAAA